MLSGERAPKCGRCGATLGPQIAAVMQGAFLRLLRRLFQKGAKVETPTANNPNLKANVDMLAKRIWGSRQDIETNSLELAIASVQHISDHNQFVKALLKHARKIAPSISVPMLAPRIIVEPMCDAAGKFVEQDGWVKIAVNTTFFKNVPAARAILCHELCHYILTANGIRRSPDIENEYLTDTAMFAFGLGQIFLAGYKRSATEYRAGHRLGYLTDSEYCFLVRYVNQLRNSEPFLDAAKRHDDWRWDRSMR